jgi:hypothetical protein
MYSYIWPHILSTRGTWGPSGQGTHGLARTVTISARMDHPTAWYGTIFAVYDTYHLQKWKGGGRGHWNEIPKMARFQSCPSQQVPSSTAAQLARLVRGRGLGKKSVGKKGGGPCGYRTCMYLRYVRTYLYTAETTGHFFGVCQGMHT